MLIRAQRLLYGTEKTILRKQKINLEIPVSRDSWRFQFLYFHLQPMAKKLKSYIKDINDFLKRLHSLTNLPDNSLLCTMDAVGLYPNIPHDDRLYALKKKLNERDEKDVSTDTLVELAELVLKNNIFNFNEKTLRQPTIVYLWQNWRKQFLKKLIINHIYDGGI